MSKIYTQLRMAEKLRLGNPDREGRVLLQNRESCAPASETAYRQNKKTLTSEIAITLIAVLSLVLTAISMNSYMAVKTLLAQDIRNAETINRMEKLLDACSRDAKTFALTATQIKDELKTSNNRIKNQTALIEDLRGQAEGQHRLMNSVVKVKNDLLARVARLEEQSAASQKPLR